MIKHWNEETKESKEQKQKDLEKMYNKLKETK